MQELYETDYRNLIVSLLFKKKIAVLRQFYTVCWKSGYDEV